MFPGTTPRPTNRDGKSLNLQGRRSRQLTGFKELLVVVCHYPPLLARGGLHQPSLLSQRMPAKFTVFMAVRAVLAGEMAL